MARKIVIVLKFTWKYLPRTKEGSMAKGYEEPNEFDEVVPGVTWGDAKACLPKVDIEKILKMKADDLIKEMNNYVIARLHLEFLAGNPAALGPISKLHVDPHVAKAKIQMIVTNANNGKPGSKALSYEGPKAAADSLLEHVLSSGVELPEGNYEVGMKNLGEIRNG